MGRAEAGTPKAIANSMKARGLTRLRWYCQVCSKACRDANGYKCHVESEAHMRAIAAVAGSKGQRAGKVVHDFSSQFQSQFISLLSRRFSTRRVLANQVYQEFIQDRHHLHMNATRWVTLSEFVKHLGRAGIVKVDDSPLGWFISWIDNSPSALARQDALRKMDRTKMDDEQRTRRLLDEQIRRAKEQGDGEDPAAEARRKVGIVRGGEEPVKLALGLRAPGAACGAEEGVPEERDEARVPTAGKEETGDGRPTALLATTSATATPSPGPFGVRANPLKAGAKANPLKANALKTEPVKETAKGGTKRAPPTHVGAAERIIMEETARRGGPQAGKYGPVMERGAKRTRF
ncbi:hypothetical protein MSPP1_004134 [Malassezia sp. CBS 17886]|nr:hypothetical protein MSPP1_004134 [Malassezia sp. CBS 17886]